MSNIETFLKSEWEKPLDLSDVDTPRGESAKAELRRLRAALREQKIAEAEADLAAEAKAEAKGEASESKDEYPPTGLSEGVRKLPEWIQLGCGDVPYNCPEKNSTFATDNQTPAEMPDLSEHTSFMAETLKNNPELYEALKDKTTSSGVTLAQCIKCGVDNKGHPMIKIVGMTAGDAESYEVFKDLFDPVISARHGGYDHRAGPQPTNLDIEQLSTTDIDPYNSYVLTTRVRTGRSIKGYKFPPTISFEERRALEALIVKGLLSMEGDLKGDYFPLHGSRSYAPKPNGMSPEKEEALRKMGNLFQEPDSTLLLSSGMARHWPDGRGVFHNDEANLFVWCSEEDHMRIVSMQGSRDAPSEVGKDIRATTARFIRACDAVQKVLVAEGADFVHDANLGWVLTCPSNLGTGLRAGTMVMLPKISAREDFKALCGKLGLQVRGTGGVDSTDNTGTWDISNSARIGKGEVDLVNDLIEGAAKLVKWEASLDGKVEGATAESVEAEIQAVLGA
jgi:creatine kinase